MSIYDIDKQELECEKLGVKTLTKKFSPITPITLIIT